MDCPRHIGDSASQLFFQDKQSLEFKALSVVSTLPHPQRPILASFVLAAVDHEAAARFLLDEVSDGDSGALLEFLADWIALCTKCRLWLLAISRFDNDRLTITSSSDPSDWFK
jgi:hypothetical protein